MSLLEDAFKGKLWTGLAVGVGVSVLAPVVIPVLGSMVKPVTKSALKGWIILREKGTELFAVKKKTAPASAGQKAISAGKPRVRTFTGTVRETDAHAQTVTVVKKAGGKNVEAVLHIAVNAVIRQGRKKKAISNIRQGDKVVSKYTEVAGRMVAKNLAIMPEQKAASAAKNLKTG